jgi:predicted RNase H-like HicB family nuclease
VSTYAVIIERADDGGYGAWSPDLPGCVALGDTPEETLAEMREAMQGHLEVMRERGEALPHPTTVIATTVDAA